MQKIVATYKQNDQTLTNAWIKNVYICLATCNYTE